MKLTTQKDSTRLFFGLLTAILTSNTAFATPTVAKKADSFVDSIGVNIHLHYTDTIYNDWPKTKSALQNLGVRHIRDGLTKTTWQAFYDRQNELPSIGIKGLYLWSKPLTTQTAKDDFVNAANQTPEAIEGFEGINEANQNVNPDTGSNWTTTSAAAQQLDLFNLVKGNTSFSNRPVVALSYTNNTYATQLGNLGTRLDKGNFHPYPGGVAPELGSNLQDNLNIALGVSGNKPVWATETGYTNALNRASGHVPASEAAAGKYAGRVLLFNWNKGVERNYWYELFNRFDNPALNEVEDHFGLYKNDGTTIKPAGTTIKNLISLLADATFNATTKTWSSPAFTAGSLDYFLSGPTQNIHQTLLQKSNGKFYLVLWQGVSSFDTTNQQDINVPPVAVTLALNTAISSARSFTPLTGTTATNLTISANKITLNVPDHPIIVELTPGGSAGSFSQSTIGVEADTFADSLNPTNNMGTWTGMNIEQTASPTRTMNGFLRFNLSGLNGNVVAAYLRVRASGQTAPNTQNINFVASDSWGETTLNWNNKPAIGALLTTSVPPVAPQWLEVNVTNQVATEKSGDGKISFALSVQTASARQSFYTREAAVGFRPELVILTTSSAPLTGTYTPIADAHIQQSTPTSNYGTLDRIQVRNSAAALASYLKFDVSGLSGSITSAKLRLKASYYEAPATLFAQTVSDDTWSETGIVWNNAPTTGATLATASAPTAGNWVEFDVTSQVGTETLGNGLFSVAVGSQTSGPLEKFYSRETTNATDRPQLVIITGGSAMSAPVSVSLTPSASNS